MRTIEPETTTNILELERGYKIPISYSESILSYSEKTGISHINLEEIKTLLKANNEIYVALNINYISKNFSNIKIPVELTKWNGVEHKKTQTITLEITEDIAYLIGVLTGDGGLSNIKKSTEVFRVSSVDMEIVSNIKKIIQSIDKKSSIEKVKSKRKGDCDWSIKSRIIAKLIYNTKLNVTSDKKFVPDFILSSPLSVINSFIKGLFDTDGSALNNGYIEYSSCSSRLAYEVHNILFYNSIRASKRFKPNSKKGAWVIAISYSAQEFYQKIGFNLKRKQERKSLLSAKRNSNWKIYPPILNTKMKEVLYAKGPKYYWGQYQFPIREWGDYIHSNKTPDTKKLGKFIEKTNTKNKEIINIYMNGTVIWLRIKSIDKEKEALINFNIAVS